MEPRTVLHALGVWVVSLANWEMYIKCYTILQSVTDQKLLVISYHRVKGIELPRNGSGCSLAEL